MKRVWKKIKAIVSSPFTRKGLEENAPVILPRDKHTISRKNIDPDALKVLYRLKRFGHTAYLVGGGVRDLLLGLPAKDFDIGTSAHPNQVKKVFANCRLVGKRFRLAHILFRGKAIEVSTFRKTSEYDLEQDDLLIRSDNTFGSPAEDAFRRDFTINGLFYNISDFTVIDYVGGLKDLDRKVIRVIGDPNIRLREDPIRMLRAIRLAARLDFEIEPETLAAISAHRSEIWKGATPRITDELQRMLRSGHSRRAFSLLMETGLLEMLMPELSIVLVRRGQAPSFWAGLEAADRLVAGGRDLSFATLYASLMIHLFRSKVENTKGHIDLSALADESLYPIAQRLGIPKRVVDRAKALLMVQRRFQAAARRDFQPGPFVHRPYFQEALDLFRIHAHASPETMPLLDRWQQVAGGEGTRARDFGRGMREPRPPVGTEHTERAEHAARPESHAPSSRFVDEKPRAKGRRRGRRRGHYRRREAGQAP